MNNLAQENFVEDKSLRENHLDKLEVLDKVKDLLLLPGTEIMTTKMVSEYYEVEFKTIEKLRQRNYEELNVNGMVMTSYNGIKDLVNSDNMSDLKISKQGTYIFSKRAVLNVGMLLRDSEVAKRVRTALLDIQEVTTEEQKLQGITQEEILLLDIHRSKNDPIKLTLAICEYQKYNDRHIAKLNQTIAEQKPKVETWERFMDVKDNTTIAKLAKTLNIKGVGRNKLYEILRDKEVLRYNNEPYQRYVDSGYFEMAVKTFYQGNKEKEYIQTFVTPKGMDYIYKKLKDWKYI